jgi:hypothetical protein
VHDKASLKEGFLCEVNFSEGDLFLWRQASYSRNAGLHVRTEDRVAELRPGDVVVFVRYLGKNSDLCEVLSSHGLMITFANFLKEVCTGREGVIACI